VLRAVRLYIIKIAGANKYTLLGIVRDSTPPLTLQLGEWDNSVINIPALLLLTLPALPDGIFKGVQCTIKHFKQAYILGGDIARYSPNSS
jgi:hypothetical protein